MSRNINLMKAGFSTLILAASIVFAVTGADYTTVYSGGVITYTGDNANVGAIIGNNTGDVVEPTTTVRQTMTGIVLTGVDDVLFGPAYTWARTYGVTTIAPTSARLNNQVLRYEFAIMMINYIENVEGKTITHRDECNISQYADYKNMDSSVRLYVQKACDVGLMGWKSKVGNTQVVTVLLPRFRPFDVLSTAEMNMVAIRYVPSTVRLFPTSNTRADVLRFLYSISPRQ